MMSEANDDAVSLLLRLEQSIATTAANTTGSDMTKRQKLVNKDTDALFASSADDSVQLRVTANPMSGSTDTLRPSTTSSTNVLEQRFLLVTMTTLCKTEGM